MKKTIPTRHTRKMTSRDLQHSLKRSLRVESLEARRLLTVSLPELISHNTANTAAGDSVSTYSSQSLSADGRYQVFSSAASDIVAGDTNGSWDVFLRDLELGTTQLISRSPSGTPANSASEFGVISADGNYVAFSSTATDLAVTGTTASTGYNQIYRWSRATGAITLVSVNFEASEGGNGYSYNPSISGDGSRIAYQTGATDLLAGITDDNGWYDVYVRDLTGIPQTILVSRSADDPLSTGNAWSDGQQISQDGSRVVYLNRSTNIENGVNDINGTGADLVVFDVALGVNAFVSLETTAPTSGNAGSTRTDQSLSADGRYEVFSSKANDLVDGDLNGQTDVFLRDLLTGTTTLISRSATGQSANSHSDFAVISADGHYVAFHSQATDLDIDPLDGPNSTSGYSQIYRWQRATGKIDLVSPNFDNTDGALDYSYNPSISGDGQRIVFQTLASNLIAGISDGNGWYDVYLRDYTTPTPTSVLVSRSSSDPLNTSNSWSDTQQISRDGSRIVYLTRSTDIQAGLNDINGTQIDLVVFDVGLETNNAITTQSNAPSSGNAQSSRTSQSLSADGRYEVFTSSASDLVDGDFNGTSDVFLRDLVAGTTTLISRTATGESANNSSHYAVISANGDYVAFFSHATNFNIDPLEGPNSTLGNSQIYRWNRLTGDLELASPNFSNTDGGNVYSYDPSISGDGERIAFKSYASDLVEGITDDNGWFDIFLRDFTTPTPTTRLVSHSFADPMVAGNSWSDSHQISRDGNRILYASRSTDVEAGVSDVNGATADLVSFEISTGLNTYVTVQSTEASSANAGSSRTNQSLSADGRYEVFTSTASDLVEGDITGTADVFLRDLLTGATTLISRAAGGGAANSNSGHAVISAEGDYVAFQSYATNLDIDPMLSPNSTNGSQQVYRWHRDTGEIILISVNDVGSDGGSGESTTPTISADGTRVAYQSQAIDLVPGVTDMNGWWDVFVRDVPTSTSYLVSRSYLDAALTGDSYSYSQQISRDGSTVYFLSVASDIGGVIDGNGAADDLFAFDIALGTNTTINLIPDGSATGNSYVHSYDVSNDGQTVVFASYASDLHADDTDASLDLFVRNLSTPFTGLDLVSTTTADAAKGDWNSYFPSLSGDGRYVAFMSDASNLSPLDGNFTTDIYVKDISSRELTLVSVGSTGTSSGNSSSHDAQISNDGSTVAFYSYATDLDGSLLDDNSTHDVFVRNWQAAAPSTILASRTTTASGNGFSWQPELNNDGSRLIFISQATDLVSSITDVNGTGIDLFSFLAGSVTLVTEKAPFAFTGSAGFTGVFDMSNNGRWVAYSTGSAGVVADTVQGLQVYVRDLVDETNERVSVASGGSTTSGTSTSPAISGNGRYVAFDSNLNLSPLDTNWWQDIYIRDRWSDTTTLVSGNHDGTSAGDNSSHEPAISDDGLTVAFYSYATDLDTSVPDDNGVHDVFVSKWQSPAPAPKLVSRNLTQAGNSYAWQPELNDNGSQVVFISYSTDLVEGIADSNGTAVDIFASAAGNLQLVSVKGSGLFTLPTAVDPRFDLSDSGEWIAFSSSANGVLNDGVPGLHVYVYNAVASSTERVSLDVTGAAGNSSSYAPSISGDGRYVAFESYANLDPLDTNGWTDIYVRDLVGDLTTLITISSDGTTASSWYSYEPHLSNDGSTVAFYSYAENLDAAGLPNNGYQQLFLRNWQDVAPSTTLVSRNATEAGNLQSSQPELSDDGSRLIFTSQASNLMSGFADVNGSELDIFTFASGALSQVSIKGDGRYTLSSVDGTFDMSDDGRWIAFNSSAVGVVAGNTPRHHVYVRDVQNGVSELVSIAANGTAGNSSSHAPSISGDGQYVAFESYANLNPLDTNWWTDIYVRDRVNSETILVTVTSAGTDAGSWYSHAPQISRDGSTVAFYSYADNLDADVTDTSGTLDVFLRKWRSTAPVTDLVSVNHGGTTSGDNQAWLPQLSANGKTLAFLGLASDHTLLTDTNGTYDVFVVRAAALALTAQSANKLEGDSSTQAYTFTVTRTWFTGNEVTVDWNVIGIGTNPANALDFDGSFPSGQITFAPNETEKTISVLVSGERDVELDETFRVVLSNSTDNSQIIDATADGLILNNDIDLEILADSASKAEGASSTTAFTFTVNRLGYTGVATNVTWTVSGSGANPASASDFGGSFPTGTTTFAIGETAKTITVLVSGDNLVELNETFRVTLSNPSGNADINIATATGTILNDDSAVVNLVGVTANEATGGLNFTVTLSNPVDVATTVAFSTLGTGTATAGVDFTALSGHVVTFGAGSTTTQTVTVSVTDESLVELNETVNAQIASLAAGGRSVTIGAAARTGTINNDDSAVVNLVGVSASEATGALNYTVTLSNPVDVATTVAFSTLATGTAAAGVDFTALSGQVVTFAAGSTTTQTVTVSVANENLVELNETVNAQIASLSAGGRSVTIGTAAGTGTITNDDSAVVNLVGVSANEATGALNYTVTLSNPVDVATTVAFSTLATGTAAAGVDFTALSGQVVTFAAGSTTTQTVTVSVTDESLVELNETVNAQIASLSAGGRSVTIETAANTGTIANDDSAVVNLVGVSASEATGGLNFTVTLSNPVDVATTVAFSTLATGTATAGVDFTALSGLVVTFSAGSTTTQTVTVSVTNENLVELNETVNAQIASLAAGGRSVTIGTAARTGTITNDDSAVVNLVGVSASEATGALNYTVTLSNPVDVATTVAFSTLGTGTAAAGVDFTALSGHVVTFAAGSTTTQTVTVSVANENLVELNETVNAQIASLSAGGRSVTIGTAAGTGTITNDDSAVVNLVGVTANEATGALSFTVTLSNPVDVATTVEFSTLNSGSATAGVDFTAISGQVVTFAAGSTTAQTVTVVVIDDSTFEPDETVDAQLAALLATGRAVTLGTATATSTIANDDPPDVTPPTISSVIAGGATWSPAFIDTIDGGGSGAGNGRGFQLVAGSVPLPWSSVNRLYVQFSEAVSSVSLSNLELRNSTGTLPFTLAYNSTTFLATLSFATPLAYSKLRLAVSDTIQDAAGNALDGDASGAAGGIFNFRFDVMPGDANGDGRTNGGDLTAFSAAFNSQPGQANFNPFANWNGDARVNGGDLTPFSNNFNRRISTLGEPAAPFSGSGGAGGSSHGRLHDAFFAYLGDDDEERDDAAFESRNYLEPSEIKLSLTPKRGV